MVASRCRTVLRVHGSATIARSGVKPRNKMRRMRGCSGASISPRKLSSSGTVTPGARMSPTDDSFLASRKPYCVSANDVVNTMCSLGRLTGHCSRSRARNAQSFVLVWSIGSNVKSGDADDGDVSVIGVSSAGTEVVEQFGGRVEHRQRLVERDGGH